MIEKVYIVAWIVGSLITLMLYAIDKNKAIKNKRRISEKTLLLFTVFLGSIGSLIGIFSLRHKTKHWYFVFTAVLSFIVHITIFIFLILR